MSYTKFNKKMGKLNIQIIGMGCFVENAVEDSVRAFESNNLPLCQSIIQNCKSIDKTEKKIESECIDIIARESPVSYDMRKIKTALKVIAVIKHIGEHAANIAELTMRVSGKNIFADRGIVKRMADAAVKMVRNAVTAYANYDFTLAQATEANDDVIDEYFNDMKRELAEIFKNQPQDVDNAIDFLLIAKYLERIADQAVCICEWVNFIQTGENRAEAALSYA